MIDHSLPPLINDGRPTYIYVLSDPSGISRRIYVGETCDLKGRLQQHLNPAKLKNTSRKNSWILSLKARNVKPHMGVIEVVEPGGNYQQAEIELHCIFQKFKRC